MGNEADRAAAKLRMMNGLRASQGIKNPENVTSIEENISTAKPKDYSLLDVAAAAATAVPNAIADLVGGKAPDMAGDVPGAAAALDDKMRVASGGLGDLAAGVGKGIVSGDLSSIPANIQEEARKTAKAKMMLSLRTGSDNLAQGLETSGEVGQFLALPGKLLETPIKAMATAGGFGVAQEGIDRLGKGEPLLERPGEYATTAAVDAVGGLGGYYLGKMASSVLAKFGVGNKTLTEAADKLIANNQKIVSESLAAMDGSNIALNPMGLKALQNKVVSDLGGIRMSSRVTPHTYPAYMEISKLVKEGKPVSIRALNDIKERILRDAVFDSKGLAKDTAQLTDIDGIVKIGKSIDDFISSLPVKRNLMMKGAKVTEGVNAWNRMKEFNQYVFRNERIMTLVANAENVASSGKLSFENALQDEFLKFYTGNRQQINRWFTPEQVKSIEKIAKGDKSKYFFNVLDRQMGSTIFAPATRMTQSVYGALFEGPESRIAAEKLLNATANNVSKANAARVLPQVGTAIGAPVADTTIAR